MIFQIRICRTEQLTFIGQICKIDPEIKTIGSIGGFDFIVPSKKRFTRFEKHTIII